MMMHFAFALIVTQTTPALPSGLVDLDEAYATAESRIETQAVARGEGGLTPIENFLEPASAILVGCCADFCLDVGCQICADACFDSLPPAFRAAWSVGVYGGMLGCVAGGVVGLIPALITAVISFSLSVGAVGADEAAGAAIASFAATNSLFSTIGLGLGAVVGGILGFIYGEELLTDPHALQPSEPAPKAHTRPRRESTVTAPPRARRVDCLR